MAWLRSLSLTLGCAPRPEGRGDRSECADASALAGEHRDYRLKPSLLSARTSPLSLWERAGVRDAEPTRNTTATGSSIREQARSYEKPCPPGRWARPLNTLQQPVTGIPGQGTML
ncbi:hypothetical protein Pssp01_10990 [Pseudomonas sp. NBRC 100443]|nr:hypothetical protein Pssp01_10990 [Pseudomonas sp. NBRC 100443]